MKSNVIFLIIGIVVFLLGCYQYGNYEDALKVDAVITRIETEDTNDDVDPYTHTYYGEYEVNGTKYTDKKLTQRYSNSSMPDMKRGDTVSITVNPDNPGKKVTEGGIFGTVGLVLIVYNAVVLVKKRKIKKAVDVQQA